MHANEWAIASRLASACRQPGWIGVGDRARRGWQAHRAVRHGRCRACAARPRHETSDGISTERIRTAGHKNRRSSPPLPGAFRVLAWPRPPIAARPIPCACGPVRRSSSVHSRWTELLILGRPTGCLVTRAGGEAEMAGKCPLSFGGTVRGQPIVGDPKRRERRAVDGEEGKRADGQTAWRACDQRQTG